MSESVMQGGKVKLRPKEWRDVQHDYEWARDPELARLDATWPITLSMSEYVTGYEEELRRPSQGRYRFAIETLDGQHIGNCMFYDLSDVTRQTEMGILIGERGYWDKGYGSEATCLLLDYIFNSTDVQRVYLHSLDWNTRAHKGFRKCGFVDQGFRQSDGYNYLLMDITREQWQKRKGKSTDSTYTHPGDGCHSG